MIMMYESSVEFLASTEKSSKVCCLPVNRCSSIVDLTLNKADIFLSNHILSLIFCFDIGIVLVISIEPLTFRAGVLI